MSKGLEALAYLMERQNNLEKYGSSGEFSISKLRLCLDVIEKELKALEIVKNKRVDVDWLFRCIAVSNDPLKPYNRSTHPNLEPSEYELLTEVLE